MDFVIKSIQGLHMKEGMHIEALLVEYVDYTDQQL